MMNFNYLSVAIVSYLTGAVVVYAYLNRNRYIDLVLASVAIFSFGTSMLLRSFNIIPDISEILAAFSQGFAVVAVFFLVLRIASGAIKALKRYLGS